MKRKPFEPSEPLSGGLPEAIPPQSPEYVRDPATGNWLRVRFPPRGKKKP